jgi:colicin import membrane protein
LTGVAKIQHDNFLTQIDHHVKQFWSLPEWLARGGYKARVKIFIDFNGLLLKAELVSTSGNSSYDEVVLETVKKAVPYPVPPEKFRDIMSVSGMVLGFPE